VQKVRQHHTDDVAFTPGLLLSAVAGGGQTLSRVATLGQSAQYALRMGQAREAEAALAEQREAAGTDQAALVWSLTVSSVSHAILGHLTQSRADLAEVRQITLYAAPLLAQPFWRFTEVLCDWLGGKWVSAHSGAEALDVGQLSPVNPVMSGIILAVRTELLRGLGQARESRLLAQRLPEAAPVELCAWAQAGLDADAGDAEAALSLLADACDPGSRVTYRGALPLVLHRMAEIAYLRGDRGTASYAAAAMADFDQTGPLTKILTEISQAYATGDPKLALRAQQLAESEGAATLAAEALTVRGRLGDDPAKTLTQAYAAWDRMGAVARARTVASAMRAAGLAPPAPGVPSPDHATPGRPAVLTPRERSVALLVHDGRTNQQIAHALNISVKTVEAYLTRLYRKSGCSSRVELAVAVTERRLQIGEKDS
jgi:DNA-binding CsgD family transcriptional regulator